MNLPINPGPGFNQVLDVLRNEIVTYDLAGGHGKFTEDARHRRVGGAGHETAHAN